MNGSVRAGAQAATPLTRSRGAKLIPPRFFQRDPVTCARELIGRELVWEHCAGIVVEAEAYLAIGDEACHTFVRPSARAFIDRNKAGAAYIYFNYGVHWMLNVLVKGNAHGFVLIRALQPTKGIELMRRRRGLDELKRLCSGPGKLTQALGITGDSHKIDLCGDRRHCFLQRRSNDIDVASDARIGITRAAEFPWRFTLRGSEFLSRAFRSE